jgi:hypothetical protein
MQLSKERLVDKTVWSADNCICVQAWVDDALVSLNIPFGRGVPCYFRFSWAELDYQLIKCLIFTLPWHSGLKRQEPSFRKSHKSFSRFEKEMPHRILFFFNWILIFLTRLCGLDHLRLCKQVFARLRILACWYSHLWASSLHQDHP